MIRVQYQGLTAPLVESQPTETREGFIQGPEPVRRRGLPVAVLVATMVVAPVFVPSEDAVASAGGSFISTGALPILQYQEIAGPLFIEAPSLVPDTPYGTSAYRLVRPRGLHAAYHPAYVADKFTAPTAATVTDLSWTPEYPDSLSRLKGLDARFQRAYAADRFEAPTDVDTSPTLSWQPEYPDRHVYQRALSLLSPAHEIFAVQVEVPVMSWTGLYLDPPVLRKGRRQLLSGVTQPFDVEVTVQPPAPALSWQPEYPDIAWPKRRSLAALDAKTEWYPFVSDATVVVPPLGWQGRYADRVPGLRPVLQPNAFFFDRFDAPDAVTAPALTVAVYVHRAYGRRPVQQPDGFTAPLFVTDVTEPAPELSWQPDYPDRIVRFVMLAAHQDVWASSIYITDVTDPAVPLSWAPTFPDRIVRPVMLAALQDDLNWNTEVPVITIVPVEEVLFGRGRYTVQGRKRNFIVPPRRRNWTV